MAQDNRNERNEKYLFEERTIFESILSNDVELNRTMRYYSGVILALLTVYIDWDIDWKTLIMLFCYAPFVSSITLNIFAYLFVQSGLHEQSRINAKYYAHNIPESINETNDAGEKGAKLVRWSIYSFISGIMIISISILFGIVNIKEKGGNTMANERSNNRQVKQQPPAEDTRSITGPRRPIEIMPEPKVDTPKPTEPQPEPVQPKPEAPKPEAPKSDN